MHPDTKIPIGVVIGRIASIVGLSCAVAIGILLLLSGTYWIAGLVALACALPFAALLRFVEFQAEKGILRGAGAASEWPDSESANQPVGGHPR